MNEVKAETTGTSALSARTGRRLHPLPVRIMHWINAVVMLVMITSGGVGYLYCNAETTKLPVGRLVHLGLTRHRPPGKAVGTAHICI